MIPSDPGMAAPSPLIQHLTTLYEQFKAFDTAKEKVHGSPWIGGGPDNRVSKDDLKAVAEDGTKSGRFTRSQVEAAQFFLSHPEAMARLDTAAVSDNGPGAHESADGFVGELDAKAALRDAQDFDGAGTFKSRQPAVPDEGGNEAQQDAAELLRAQDLPLPPGETTTPEQIFKQDLQEHHGDAAYLHDFFGALGANAAGRALFNALNGGGDSRAEARDAISTLQSLGLLTQRDLSAGTFTTTARSGDSFSLETLMAADRIQREVEGRRARMGDASKAEDSSVYNAYQALLTMETPEHRRVIRQTADKYGIEPALLGGSVASEMDFDHTATDKAFDGLSRLGSPLVRFGSGPGVASVHRETLERAVAYLKAHDVPGAKEAAQFLGADPEGTKVGANFNGSVEAAAICLAALRHAHGNKGANELSPQDMAVIWGGYRTGVGGLELGATGGTFELAAGDHVLSIPNPLDDSDSGPGYSRSGFEGNRVEDPGASKLVEATGDVRAAMGGNAYQAEAYFEYMIKRYG